MGIDLSKFCSRDKKREAIKEPFSKGDWTYATDGYIAIRVPALPYILERKGAPDCERIFTKAEQDGPYVWVAVPEVKVEIEQCEYCDGTGIKDLLECGECDGDGSYEKPAAIRFAIAGREIGLNVIYLNLIRKELPNPQIGLTEKAVPNFFDYPYGEPVKISFNGGEGLLMPMLLFRRGL